MNRSAVSSALRRFAHRAMTRARRSPPQQQSGTFGPEGISRVLVINLDRQDARWRDVQAELRSIRGADGRSLIELTTRISAVDARYLTGPAPSSVDTTYSLADQLFVDPQPVPFTDPDAKALTIAMSRPEVAVALSHIRAWELVARGDVQHTLVLEDDVFFRRRFTSALDDAWSDIEALGLSFDVLFAGYGEALAGAEWSPVSGALRSPRRGIWQLSGYVLSRSGAETLLGRLPVRGPVDLWINHLFDDLEVLALYRSAVDQRPDLASGNAYSVLPVLSKVGLVTSERAPTIEPPESIGPLVVFGAPGSGVQDS